MTSDSSYELLQCSRILVEELRQTAWFESDHYRTEALLLRQEPSYLAYRVNQDGLLLRPEDQEFENPEFAACITKHSLHSVFMLVAEWSAITAYLEDIVLIDRTTVMDGTLEERGKLFGGVAKVVDSAIQRLEESIVSGIIGGSNIGRRVFSPSLQIVSLERCLSIPDNTLDEALYRFVLNYFGNTTTGTPSAVRQHLVDMFERAPEEEMLGPLVELISQWLDLQEFSRLLDAASSLHHLTRSGDETRLSAFCSAVSFLYQTLDEASFEEHLRNGVESLRDEAILQEIWRAIDKAVGRNYNNFEDIFLPITPWRRLPELELEGLLCGSVRIAECRRKKQKKKSKRVAPYPDSDSTLESAPSNLKLSLFLVDKDVKETFDHIFDSANKGKLEECDFLTAMVAIGFSIKQAQGSRITFIPPTGRDCGLKQCFRYHMIHNGNDEYFDLASALRTKLRRAYDWDKDYFGLK
ncbi:uncharacterized protein EV420DRAFT_362538 [Desarmillaria tabescens]|uniref:Uncharacterized protein n=1 Tax=Armillaria tabescens TaxID=1929756 RepID=A0AA39KEL4_ARMTA|nr:uncharacterized protein EV420DRAFT_362538 [Desarmillaria tabescens]KAK0458535.1 hypothetical protein EV420DRAFT_362538 [Desarmillaria tabescens]